MFVRFFGGTPIQAGSSSNNLFCSFCGDFWRFWWSRVTLLVPPLLRSGRAPLDSLINKIQASARPPYWSGWSRYLTPGADDAASSRILHGRLCLFLLLARPARKRKERRARRSCRSGPGRRRVRSILNTSRPGRRAAPFSTFSLYERPSPSPVPSARARTRTPASPLRRADSPALISKAAGADPGSLLRRTRLWRSAREGKVSDSVLSRLRFVWIRNFHRLRDRDAVHPGRLSWSVLAKKVQIFVVPDS